jgi:hypothetical protein
VGNVVGNEQIAIESESGGWPQAPGIIGRRNRD